MCTKGELGGGGSFCIERLSMNVPLDRYHTKANTELEKEEQRDNSFPLSCTRKTVYERGFFSVMLYCERSQVYTFDQFT